MPSNRAYRGKSMKIGIIGAMEEVTLLRDKIENRQTISLGGCEISSQLDGTEVRFKSGIGKVAAALGATLLLEHQPDDYYYTGSAR